MLLLFLAIGAASADDLARCGVYTVQGRFRLLGNEPRASLVVAEGARSEYRLVLELPRTREGLEYYDGEPVQARIELERLSKSPPLQGRLLELQLVLPSRKAKKRAITLESDRPCKTPVKPGA